MKSRIAVTLTIVCCLAAEAAAQWQVEAALSAASQVPPTPSAARGLAQFTLNQPSNTLSYLVEVSGVQGTFAHVHIGAVGVSGAVIFPLAGGPTRWEGTTPALSSSQIVTMLNEGMYCDVHSSAFPGGEIRGQMIPAKKLFFSGLLQGSQATPPTGSTATGFGTARLNESEYTLTYELEANVANATAAHIHFGLVGAPGPIIVSLVGGSGHWCGISAPLTPFEVTALKNSAMYFDVASPSFPSGEIRGQISPAKMGFSCTLDAAQETPPTPSTATGFGHLELDTSNYTVNYTIAASGFAGTPTFAHIHRGVLDEPGPVIFPITGGPTVWSGTVGPLVPAQLDELFKGDNYVNLHTTFFGTGEIRGQIRPNPYIFGYAGLGTAGRSQINVTDYVPSAPGPITISLTNALPNTSASLLIGGSSSFWAAFGAPLPVALPPLGVVWIDVDSNFLIPTATDALGCAKLSAPVPIGLAGLRVYAQWAFADPINSAGLVLSDAAEVMLLF